MLRLILLAIAWASGAALALYCVFVLVMAIGMEWEERRNMQRLASAHPEFTSRMEAEEHRAGGGCSRCLWGRAK